MSTENKPQAKPDPDPAKAPYGNEAELPMAAHQPADPAAPAVDLLANGVTHAHEGLGSFDAYEAPVFPPVHVGQTDPQAPEPALQVPASSEADPDAADADAAGRFRAFAREHPLATVFAAAALGALIVRLSR